MKIYLGSLVVILIATTISASDISPALIEECRNIGEVARFGGDYDCDKTCDSPPRQVCHIVGMTRCFCPEGKVRITYRGRCIPPSECPARNGQKFRSNTFNRGKCPRKNRQRNRQPPYISPTLIENCREKGEVAGFGGDQDCDETCEGSPRTCNLIGMYRCFCPNGKVRITNRGRCIPPSECPARNGQKFRSNTFNRG